MKANKYISKKEHKLLLLVAFTSFVFALSIFSLQGIKDYNDAISKGQNELEQLANLEQIISFAACGGIDYRVSFLHFLTLFIFVALLKTKRFFLSSFLTVFYAAVFIYGLSARYDGSRLGGEEFSPKVDFLDKVYRAAFDFDYVAALFISILLFWQISILLRMLIKTLQKERALP